MMTRIIGKRSRNDSFNSCQNEEKLSIKKTSLNIYSVMITKVGLEGGKKR